jgi:hypothetical protein
MQSGKFSVRFRMVMMPLSLVLLSCGEKDADEGNMEESSMVPETVGTQASLPIGEPAVDESLASTRPAANHEEILVRLFAFKREFLGAMGEITDAASARGFVQSLEERTAGISQLLEKAESLPPASPAIRSRYQKLQGELAEESDLLRRQMEERLREHPEAAEIGEILAALVEDEEAEDLNGAFEKLYQEQNLDGE